jgi:hypothetical protein
MKENPFDELKGEQLSSVTFVQDYLQLHFDGPFITYYQWPEIRLNDSLIKFKDQGYRDLLCGQIAKIVKDTYFDENRIVEIEFEDKSVISVSLDKQVDSYEILNFINSKQEWTII